MTLTDEARLEVDSSTSGRVRRAPRIGAAAWVFLLVAAVAGSLFVMVNPPFWGNDGLSQYSRAYQISHGHLLPQQIEWYGKGDSYGGTIPSTVWDLYGHAAEDLGSNPAEPGAMILDPELYDQLAHARYASEASNLIWFSNTAAYSPIPYIPAAAASRAAETLNLSVHSGLQMMALASLAAYIVPVFLALIFLRRSRARWLFLALALIPPALLQSATITADAMTNGIALLFAALVMRASLDKRRLTGFQTGLLYAAVVLLPICKPSYMVLVLLVLAVRKSKLAGPSWLKWSSLGMSTLLWGMWFAAARGISDVLAFYRADYEQSDFGIGPMIAQTVSDPVDFLGNVARTIFYRDNFFFLDLIGSSNVRVPSTAMLITTATIIIAVGLLPNMRATQRWVRWTWAGVAIVSVVALFATLYVSFTPVGFYLIDGVQGRYFFPLWPVILLAVACFLPLRWRSEPSTEKTVAWIVTIASICTVGATLAKFWYVVWGAA